ncbi:MAG: tetratricopeptide repeat protein [Myxococcota bacterium]
MLWAVVLSSWLGGSVTQAPAAMAKFQEGMGHYQAGRCREALVAFEDAAKVRRSSGLLRRIAECRQKLGELVPAREAWRQYLADKSIPDRETAQKELSQVEAAIAEEEKAARAQAQEKARLEAEEKARQEAEARAKAVASPPSTPRASFDHRPLQVVPRGETPVLKVRVTAEGVVASPALHVRLPGMEGYSAFRLEPVEGTPGLFTARLPPAHGEGFDYFLTLADDTGQVLMAMGSAGEPLHVVVSGAVTVSPVAVSAPAPAEGGKWSMGRSVGVAAGVVGVAAVVAGAVMAVSAQDTLANYRQGQKPDQFQEVTEQDARSAVARSHVALVLLGGGAGAAGLGFVLAF